MRHFILTDLEGVAGIDSFEHTRTDDEEQTLRLTVKGIAAGMKNTG